jgi:hypothetical protein
LTTVRHGSVIATLVITIGGLLTGCGDSGSSSAGSTSSMEISVDTAHDGRVLAGSVYTIDVDVKNVGQSDIPKLDLMFDSGDKFLDHNVIVKSDPCTIDKSLPGLACGDLPVGGDLKFTLTYQPKDAGNFKYVFEVGNAGRYLPESDGKYYSYSWTQAVLAG